MSLVMLHRWSFSWHDLGKPLPYLLLRSDHLNSPEIIISCDIVIVVVLLSFWFLWELLYLVLHDLEVLFEVCVKFDIQLGLLFLIFTVWFRCPSTLLSCALLLLEIVRNIFYHGTFQTVIHLVNLYLHSLNPLITLFIKRSDHLPREATFLLASIPLFLELLLE